MIFRNLWRRTTRSALTILGIAIGVAAVVALGAMAQGMIVNYGTAVGLNNDLLVIQANALDALFSTLDEDLGARIRSTPGVENVDPGVYSWIATDEMPFFLVFGYEPGSVAAAHYRIVEGKPVTAPKQIALGQRAADSLKKGVDDTVRLYGIPYRVVGIYETGQGMEESGGLVTLTDSQEIAQKPRKVSLFQVGLRRNADIDQVMRRIQATDKVLSVTKASEFNASQQWASMLEGFAWGIAAIAVLIGGLGMMNAMVMSVMERTREIGTLRALGWRRGRVVRLIMGEAVVLSLMGSLLGIAIGVGLTELAASVPGVGAFLEGVYSPKIFLQGLATALVLGLVGGAYPAWRAANLQPVEALRYEGGGAGDDQTDRSAAAWLNRHARALGLPARNLWRRRARTMISVTGIGIGVATLVMLGGMSKSLMGQLNSLAGSGGAGNITLMQRKVADLSLSTLDERMVSQLQAMPGVKSVSPYLMGFVMTPDMPFFLFGGLDPNSSAMSHYKLVGGRYVARPNEILLGKVGADNYKLGLGDFITLFDNRYRIVGIYETGVAYEDGGGMMALREAQRLLGRPRSVSFIFVDVTDPRQAEPVRATIARRFPEALVSLSSQFAQDTDSMDQMNAMTAAIGLLALIVGGIVVANTMMMSIYERTREIGTLRAVGWRKGRILGQVVQETLLLCLLSGLFGSAFGIIMLALLARLPVIQGMLEAEWDVGIFLQAILMALLVGLISGIYPAWRASRLQPVEALRYE
jgi:ABC-type antimicrobial peptide transport system permease subunit